jgi:hypothetical protein
MWTRTHVLHNVCAMYSGAGGTAESSAEGGSVEQPEEDDEPADVEEETQAAHPALSPPVLGPV